LSSCTYYEGGAIPFNEIIIYGQYMGLSRSEIEELSYFINTLHSYVVKHNNEKRNLPKDNSVSKR
jgi:hypothetical protein